jgi:iron(III) transport system substrate-binding protein
MKSHKRFWIWMVVLFLVLVLFSACTPKPQEVVVVYVAIDQVYAEPILKAFEQESGITVKAVYDVEAAKTTGLVNRLIAERANPQADVFLSGEFAQTILLKDESLLAAYQSPNTADIPEAFYDPQGFWTAFGGRARVLIVNTDLVSQDQMPDSIYDLLDPAFPAEKIGIAYPLFGTTATHAAALYAELGADKARDYYQQVYDRGVRVVDGNSVVRDMVVSGQLMFGLTDTDDACRAIEDGKPVVLVFPDQGSGDLGAMVIPNTAAIISGAPNLEQAKQLIDYLTSLEMEQTLVDIGWSQFPLRPVAEPPVCGGNPDIKVMEINLELVYDQFEPSKADLTELFIR